MTALGEFQPGDHVRFRDGNDTHEGRIHALNGALAIVRDDDDRSWIVEKGAMHTTRPAL